MVRTFALCVCSSLRTGYCRSKRRSRITSTGGNFCTTTGQNDMPCHDDPSQCDCVIQQWCVCQWAFASYLASAGGCSYIQTVVCEAISATKKQVSRCFGLSSRAIRLGFGEHQSHGKVLGPQCRFCFLDDVQRSTHIVGSKCDDLVRCSSFGRDDNLDSPHSTQFSKYIITLTVRIIY